MTTTFPLPTGQPLACDMSHDCHEAPSMIEDSGFIYCTEHGLARRYYGQQRVRKLRPHELRRLARGEQVTRY